VGRLRETKRVSFSPKPVVVGDNQRGLRQTPADFGQSGEAGKASWVVAFHHPGVRPVVVEWKNEN